MNQLRAIETQYKGFKFRSRLEARWAIFFDILQISWEYELDGYRLRNGSGYLPDFYLPIFHHGMFVEVKPIGFDLWKVKAFALESEKPIWLALGSPNLAVYKWLSSDVVDDDSSQIVQTVWCGIPLHGSAQGQDRMFSQPCDVCNGHDCEGLSPIEITDWRNHFDENEPIIQAVIAARSARFERPIGQLESLKQILESSRL